MSESASLLIVDDDAAVLEYLTDTLTLAGYHCRGLTCPQQALSEACEQDYDLLITDVEMPHMRGPELMAAVHRLKPEQMVLMITAFGSIDLAVDAIRAGAVDFVTKPFRIEVLRLSIERGLRERQMRREIVRLRRRLPAGDDADALTRSPAMKNLFSLAMRAAATDTTVLLTGESGVGKGMLARRIHQQSARREAPLIKVNCAAIPHNLLESELFGVRRGAFTDARSDRPGLFSQADGGTLFLDEIGEMPMDSQAKLLHALESGHIRPVGSDTELAVDVRLIAATNADLEQLLRMGSFRPDLYYRLNIIRLEIPPLRHRREDLPLLMDSFLTRACQRMGREIAGFSRPVTRWMLQHDWPGNARELANLIERAVSLAEHDVITMDDLVLNGHDPITSAQPSLHAAAAAGWQLSELEAAYIREVLQLTSGNKARAASLLGIDRRTLYRKLGAL